MMMTGHMTEYKGKRVHTHGYKVHSGRDPITGNKKYRSKGGFATKAEAKAEMNLVISSITHARALLRIQSFVPGVQGLAPVATAEPVEKILMEEFLRNWLTDYLPLDDDVRQTTIDRYESIVENHLIPNFGHLYLQDLTRAHIREWVEKMQKPGYSKHVEKLAPATIRLKAGCLSSALSEALDRELITTNPITRLKLPKNEKKEKRAITPAEAQAILDAMVGKWYYLPTYLGFYTGAREGEIMALKCSCIDLDAATLEIRAGMVKIKGKGLVEGPPKTKSSERKIKLDVNTIEALRSHIARMKADYASKGRRWAADDYLFENPNTGEPYRPRYLGDKFRDRARSLGIDDVTFHSTRHSHGSIMYNATHDLKVVQKRLGHADLSTTMNDYLHLLPGTDEDAVEDFSRAMAIEPPDSPHETSVPDGIPKRFQNSGDGGPPPEVVMAR